MVHKRITKISFCVILITLLLFNLPGCASDAGMEPEPRPEGWVFMGLADKEIHRVRLFGDYLYACANRDGLYRINVQQDGAEWQFLGLADSTLPRRIDGVNPAWKVSEPHCRRRANLGGIYHYRHPPSAVRKGLVSWDHGPGPHDRQAPWR